jgi:hypothetical protein
MLRQHEKTNGPMRHSTIYVLADCPGSPCGNLLGYYR